MKICLIMIFAYHAVNHNNRHGGPGGASNQPPAGAKSSGSTVYLRMLSYSYLSQSDKVPDKLINGQPEIDDLRIA